MHTGEGSTPKAATTIVKLVTTTATDHHQRPQHSNNSKLINQVPVTNQLVIQVLKAALTQSHLAVEKTIKGANSGFTDT